MTSRWGRERGLVVGLLVGLLVVGACTTGEDAETGATVDDTASTAEPTTDDTANTAEATEDATEEPTEDDQSAGADTPAVDPSGTEPAMGLLDERFSFAVSLLNGADIDAATYEEVFDESFRAQVPFEQFTPVLDQLRALAPFTVGEEVQRTPTDLVTELIAADGTELILSLSLGDDGRIVGLLAQPGEPPTLDPPVESLDDAVSRLQGIGITRLAAATVTGRECVVDRDVDADVQAPIGSAFKLYVLGALVDAIDAGQIRWDDQLTVTEDVKSLPSGQLQDADPGEQVTAAEAARLMISISDNTATDLLIDVVGRQAVEDAQAGWGHSQPTVNMPFPTTREFFQLKASPPAVLDAWEAGDTEQRRQILDDLSDDGLPGLDLFAGGPIRPDRLEWFASPGDLCRVLARLYERFDDDGMEPLREALTANPGVPDEEGLWETILFKGGSEPGLVAAAFLVDDGENGVYAVTASVVDPTQEIDTAESVLLLAAARDQLAQE